ncbi:AI-2 transport protein TqsA [Caballeronia terrestris]|uniref:AI-2 transport protein TqsA n=1 Tax=Caballeronia terrestris TaxID=1226301 RepID=A0A158KVU3_9BURK|nr:AI-2E family transporter [Caballeronia terrestris]SAL85272.1 AI-2 transport protein TqsA [Caballeronia terrestris]
MNGGLLKVTCAVVVSTVIGWILYIGRPVLVPIAFGVIATYVVLGIANLFQRVPYIGSKLPVGIRCAIAIALMVVAIYVSIGLLISDRDPLLALAPKYQATLLALVGKIAAVLQAQTEPTWESIRRDMLARVNLQSIVTAALASLSGLIVTIFVVALYTAFLLAEHARFRRRLAQIADNPAAMHVVAVVNEINAKIGMYLALKALLGVIVGLLSWVCMRVVGLELAELWAVLIAILNFVPYIGSVVAVAFPTLIAALQFGQWNEVLLVFASLSVLNFVVGNLVDPYLMGESLNLSPILILVSVAIWSSIWGVAGAFLAVPITVSLVIGFSSFESTRPLAMLLTSKD